MALRQLCAFALCVATSAQAPSFGINLGNVLEAPLEGEWAPPAQEYYFDDYVSAGFKYVRVPVRWDEHMGESAPYTINASWLARVHEVTGWGLARNMTILINSHHDDWIDNATGFSAALPRFNALWAQVTESFASAPLKLAFEVYNEPHEISISQLNQMYAEVVPIMRSGGGNNAARPIYLGGLSYMSAYWIAQNPDAIVWPPLPDGSSDLALRLETHSYDPWGFCGATPPTQNTWGTPQDVATVKSMYANVTAWSQAHGDRELFMGEAGCQRQAPSRTDRLKWYATVAAAARESYASHFAIWDDDGDFEIYNRGNRTWDEGVLQALGMAPLAAQF